MTAIGGALVIGAWIRIVRAKRWRYAWLFGVGAVIVVLARPFEGSVLLVPALITLGMADRSARVWLPIALIGVAGASWFAYDNYRITGHPLRLPYREYYEQYEIVPPFSFMPVATAPRTLRHFDLEARVRGTYERARSWPLFVDRPIDWLVLLRLYYGNLIWLLPLAAFAPVLWRSRRTRFAAILMAVIGTASIVEVWWYPHYAAPFTAALLILAAQSLRYLWQWTHNGYKVGRFLVRAMAVAVLLVTIESRALEIATHQTLDQVKEKNGDKEGAERALLAERSGRHVIFVRYRETDTPHHEWIYNSADIDAAPVIWARDMGRTENERLINYYAGRSFWLFEPEESMAFKPY